MSVTDWLLVVGVVILLAIGVAEAVRRRNPHISDIHPTGLYEYGPVFIPRDDAAHARAVARMAETDRIIPRLRSPLAHGAAEQWQMAKVGLRSLPDNRKQKSRSITTAMLSVQQVLRIEDLSAVLLAAEGGDEDARLAIVDDLLEDLRFASSTCGAETPERILARDGIFEITDRLRVLKGDAASPQFFAEFMAIAADYAEVMRTARPIFEMVTSHVDFVPPRFGDELFVFGAGVNGLVPWMYAHAVDEHIQDRRRTSSDSTTSSSD